MTEADPFVSSRFPRSSQYHPEWITAGVSGGANALWLTEWLSEVIELRPGMRVLDLGCGDGCLAIGASLLGSSAVTGFDVDEKMAALSGENAKAALGEEYHDHTGGDQPAIEFLHESVESFYKCCITREIHRATSLMRRRRASPLGNAKKPSAGASYHWRIASLT